MQSFRRPLPQIGRWVGYRRSLDGCRTRHAPKRACFSTSGRLTRQYASGSLAGLKDILKVSEEVTEALATNKPVVALETTVYTHGGLGNDLDLEGIVRRNGGVPAVVGILGGVPTVGLTPEEVTQMVEGSPRKVSRRDIAYVVGSRFTGQKINGGTTIAGTMVLARLAGIRVFGTGGLGGVHRGGQDTLDISADLTELGRTRMAVISGGCKGFLDIPRTLEYLETEGVLVSTFADGRKGDISFPAFWVRDTSIPSPTVLQDEKHAAAVLMAQERLNIETGLLFANPIPEEHAIPDDEISGMIKKAVTEAMQKNKTGSQNTPYVLNSIHELSQGRTKSANRGLIRSNVERATKVAVEVSRLVAEGSSALDTPVKRWIGIKAPSNVAAPIQKIIPETEKTSQADILVAGSVAVDLSCDYTGVNSLQDPIPQLHTSNPSRINQSIGGVGHNVALAAHKISKGSKVRLCSMVGRDLAGSTVLASLESSGMDTSCIQQLNPDEHPGSRTAQYVSVNDANKHLVLAMADMDIFTNQSFSPSWAATIQSSKPKWLVVDANWKDHDIRSWMQAGKRNKASIAFEPVSVEKSAWLFCPAPASRGLEGLGVFPHATVDLTTPNQYELAAMHAAARSNEYLDDARWWSVVDAFGIRGGGARDRFVEMTSAAMTDAGIPQQAVQLLPFIPTIIAKLGSEGACLVTILRKDDPRLYDAAHEPFVLSRCTNGHAHVGGVYVRMFPPVEEVADVASVNGIGDTFLGTLVAGLAQGGKIHNLVDVAQKAAVLTLRSPLSVSDELGSLADELAAASSLK
ncbi:Indigoidine synthase A like protein-domain-containing protein [Nemania sp. NC0429]|nr:Indigoidine synthase A like protein-domain-containing protein [Nemania sp. NC0429]